MLFSLRKFTLFAILVNLLAACGTAPGLIESVADLETRVGQLEGEAALSRVVTWTRTLVPLM